MTTKEWNRKLCNFSSYFRFTEFKCKCGKCNSSAYLDPRLLTYLDEMRIYFGKPVVITSGIRCKKYNNSLPGSSPISGHLRGKAADVYIKGVDPTVIRKWWISNVPGSYAYCGTKNMGNCCHVEVI